MRLIDADALKRAIATIMHHGLRLIWLLMISQMPLSGARIVFTGRTITVVIHTLIASGIMTKRQTRKIFAVQERGLNMKCKKDYRDKEKYRKYHNGCNSRYYKKTQNARNKLRRWTEDDVAMILDKKYSDNDLSTMLGRSVMSIQVKGAS